MEKESLTGNTLNQQYMPM